jgi:hypothetical protein
MNNIHKNKEWLNGGGYEPFSICIYFGKPVFNAITINTMYMRLGK